MKKKKAIRGTTDAKATKTTSGSPMDVHLLQQIVQLMSANDLNTVDVRDGEKRVILKRGATYVNAPLATMSAAPSTVAASTPAASTQTAAPVDDTAGMLSVKSPMVGTFYSAASPDAKPFVSVGSTVDEETDVCIIEAMKVFNNIKAECRGTISKVLVTNGQTVEFGQPLFLVKP